MIDVRDSVAYGRCHTWEGIPGVMRKQVEQVMKSKPVTSSPSCPLPQFLPQVPVLSFCHDFHQGKTIRCKMK